MLLSDISSSHGAKQPSNSGAFITANVSRSYFRSAASAGVFLQFSENVILAICSLFSVSVLMRSSDVGCVLHFTVAKCCCCCDVLCTSLASENEQSLTTERETRATVRLCQQNADRSLTTCLSVSGRWARGRVVETRRVVTVKTARRGLAERSCQRSTICSTDKRSPFGQRRWTY